MTHQQKIVSDILKDFRSGTITLKQSLSRIEDVYAQGITISDGFGSTWSIVCPECEEPLMQVIRPGKAQCKICG